MGGHKRWTGPWLGVHLELPLAPVSPAARAILLTKEGPYGRVTVLEPLGRFSLNRALKLAPTQGVQVGERYPL